MPTQPPALALTEGVAPAPRSGASIATVGWFLVLTLFPLGLYFVIPSMSRTSGSTDPQILAVSWAWAAIALRAACALLLRNRSMWWAVYALLYVIALFVAGFVAETRAGSALWR